MQSGLTETEFIAALAFLMGAIAGVFALRWALKLTPREPTTADSKIPAWFSLGSIALLTGVLTAALAVAMLGFHCQQTEMVQPAPFWRYGRVFYHASLIWLLVAATITDLRDYVIPDQITIPGMLLGVLGATLSGDLQMMHLWIDWNTEIPGILPPEIPAWINAGPHLHGLAWSLAGLIVGAAMTGGLRLTSLIILRQPALGLGDVTLMAMIGSFLGWQATVCVFALAPLCGIVLAMVAIIATGRGYVPYGPFLALATVVVLFTWRWLWEILKWTFGDWPSLVILSGAAFGALILLLIGLRLYWIIPVKSRRSASSETAPAIRDDREK